MNKQFELYFITLQNNWDMIELNNLLNKTQFLIQHRCLKETTLMGICNDILFELVNIYNTFLNILEIDFDQFIDEYVGIINVIFNHCFMNEYWEMAHNLKYFKDYIKKINHFNGPGMVYRKL
jgi:hypothetical protein